MGLVFAGYRRLALFDPKLFVAIAPLWVDPVGYGSANAITASL